MTTVSGIRSATASVTTSVAAMFTIGDCVGKYYEVGISPQPNYRGVSRNYFEVGIALSRTSRGAPQVGQSRRKKQYERASNKVELTSRVKAR